MPNGWKGGVPTSRFRPPLLGGFPVELGGAALRASAYFFAAGRFGATLS